MGLAAFKVAPLNITHPVGWAELSSPRHTAQTPLQVLVGLPQLRCLELQDSPYAGDSLAAISTLTTLTRLVLHLLEEPPPAAALAALAPSLRGLEVHGLLVEEGVLEEALQALTALECLAFDLGRLGQHMPSVPNAVAALPHLLLCPHFLRHQQLGIPPGRLAGPFACSALCCAALAGPAASACCQPLPHAGPGKQPAHDLCDCALCG